MDILMLPMTVQKPQAIQHKIAWDAPIQMAMDTAILVTCFPTIPPSMVIWILMVVEIIAMGPMEITSPQTPPNVLTQMGTDMETISVGKVRIISQVIQANGTILTEMDLETISMETTLTPVLKPGAIPPIRYSGV